MQMDETDTTVPQVKSYVEFTVNVIIYVDVQLTMIALQLSFVFLCIR